VDSLTVDARHEEPAQDHLVERAVRSWTLSAIDSHGTDCTAGLTAGEEAVELDEELEVDVVAGSRLDRASGGRRGIPLRRGAVRAADMVAVETGRLLAFDLVAFLLRISPVGFIGLCISRRN
jgi:hypothetical protein